MNLHKPISSLLSIVDVKGNSLARNCNNVVFVTTGGLLPGSMANLLKFYANNRITI